MKYFSDSTVEKDRRIETRYPSADRVLYTLDRAHATKVFSGVIVNISSSGLCLYTHNFLAKGQKVVVRDPLRNQHREAVICWSREIDDISSSAGLSFLHQ